MCVYNEIEPVVLTFKYKNKTQVKQIYSHIDIDCEEILNWYKKQLSEVYGKRVLMATTDWRIKKRGCYTNEKTAFEAESMEVIYG